MMVEFEYKSYLWFNSTYIYSRCWFLRTTPQIKRTIWWNRWRIRQTSAIWLFLLFKYDAFSCITVHFIMEKFMPKISLKKWREKNFNIFYSGLSLSSLESIVSMMNSFSLFVVTIAVVDMHHDKNKTNQWHRASNWP